MNRYVNLRFLLGMLSLLVLPCAALAHQQPSISFTENKGQWTDLVRFRAQIGNATLFLESDGMTWTMAHPHDLEAHHGVGFTTATHPPKKKIRSHAWKVQFVGGNTASIQGREALNGHTNFFIGATASAWTTVVNRFKAIRYSEVWNGVDVHVHSTEKHLKYDFIVAPGASADAIRLAYSGVAPEITPDGHLRYATAAGEVTEQKPFAYQVSESSVDEVACRYVLQGNELVFEFPEGYDPTRTLVIDPVVVAATLSGSTLLVSYGHCATYDDAGNIYTAAITWGSGYPTTVGAFEVDHVGSQDIVISKLNPTGTELLWASYLGGTGSETPHALITNANGELFVFGTTTSSDFPTTPGAFDTDYNGAEDIVLTRFSATGSSLLASTYVGGAGQDGRVQLPSFLGAAFRGELRLDAAGQPILLTTTASTDYPITPNALQTELGGAADVAITSLNEDLSEVVWSTFLGGGAIDTGYDMAIDENGNLVICGSAGSASFPVTEGAYQEDYLGGFVYDFTDDYTFDGFIAIVSPNGEELLASTFFGTDESDYIMYLDLDSNGDIYVLGSTQGVLPPLGDVYSDPTGNLFISKLSHDLTELQLNSLTELPTPSLGAAYNPNGLMVDLCDNVHIVGYSAMTNLYLSPDALSETGKFYLRMYSPNLENLEFASYFTGDHVDGGSSRSDKRGIIYQAVCVNNTFAANEDAWYNGPTQGWDVGVFKLDYELNIAEASASTVADVFCLDQAIEFTANGEGESFIWDFGDGSPQASGTSTTHAFSEPGVYEVMHIAIDNASCNLADTTYLHITVDESLNVNPSFELDFDCDALTITTQNQTEEEVILTVWSINGVAQAQTYDFTYTFFAEGSYTVGLTVINAACGQSESATEVIDVYPVSFTLPETVEVALVDGQAPVELLPQTENANVFEWYIDGSLSSTDPVFATTFTELGSYELVGRGYYANGSACQAADTTLLVVTDNVGINEAHLAYSVLVSETELVLTLAEPQNLQLLLFNSLGQRVYETAGAGAASIHIPLAHLAAGKYILRGITKDGRHIAHSFVR